MDQFKKIITLRNSGHTQEEIASQLGLSRRSVIRYLKSGEIPVYKRTTPSRSNLFIDFMPEIEETLERDSNISLDDLYLHLREKGYRGSLRTLRRGTINLRGKLKAKLMPIYFQREVIPGEVMEGDFTKIDIVIGGIKRRVFLWVVSLPYSNQVWATPFYYQNFECFTQGSMDAFAAFGGIAKKYRLDNLSPAVIKILEGHDRKVTKRFSEFQDHYQFFQDFCNPASGHEKGNVESNNKHFKKFILSRISISNLRFTNLESFKNFVWNSCRERNQREHIKQEELLPLPLTVFDAYRTEIARINKFSMFTVDKNGHFYSAPSDLVGLSLESRIYTDKIILVENGKVVAEHPRIYGQKGMVSIFVEHIIGAICKKPGVMKDWKHRKILFSRPIWEKFYNNMKEEKRDREYLKCLLLMKDYNKENLSAAMELAIQEGLPLIERSLTEILRTSGYNIMEMPTITTNLSKYDELFNHGDTNEITNES